MCGESLERQLVAPGSRSFAGVRANLEDVIGGRLKSVDDNGRLSGVGRPLLGGVASVVVEQLVQYDLAIAMLSRWRFPLQSNARRTQSYCSEIERRAGGNCATNSFALYSIQRTLRADICLPLLIYSFRCC